METVALPERRVIRVRGAVQGVGFRPFVYRLATDLDLRGSVRNDTAGVLIDVEGGLRHIDRFLARLPAEAPPLARIDAIECGAAMPPSGTIGFAILGSLAGPVLTSVTPDACICDACVDELLDPSDRRHRYAFINCTDCGPRTSITERLPYDRPNTSMAAFDQCPACLAEYGDPGSRRFHAQPNACPDCGPQLQLVDAAGTAIAGDDPIADVVSRLRSGAIVAIKGLGGFHLACDASRPEAVARLRARKHRDEKPFAVMVAGLQSARRWVHVDALGASLLRSRERPIVLLPKLPDADAQLVHVAPGLPELGVMLPYTPLQVLLFHEAAGRPAGRAWMDDEQPLTLVMTSANPGGDPIVTDNAEALRRLGDIADAVLWHGRDIVERCDDSVVRPAGARPQWVRRARGCTPGAVRLARSGPSVLALGAHWKHTICATRGAEAFVSAHVGDLDSAATCASVEPAVERLLALLETRPALVAHDLHPDFFSTRLAAALAERWSVPRWAVQHHHAHIAAILAEHGVDGPVIGVALDGVGLGTDGTAWGGELLLVDGTVCERVGHFRPLALPGGDRAAREPWRMAVAALASLGRHDEIRRRYGEAGERVAHLVSTGLRSPMTTSAGRWFDAAAALLGVRDHSAFEGQAAMMLEGLATAYGPTSSRAGTVVPGEDGTLDPSGLAALLAETRDASAGAALWHATLADGVARWAEAAAQRRGCEAVVLGGGCFLNRILTAGVRRPLERAGLRVLEARALPPNDGAISLGQAWVAHAHSSRS
ncbi:MAG: carbamoyltransferase HypF [Burkholderiales bacterium]